MTKFLRKKSCFIGKNVKLGKNVTIYPNNFIDGNCEIGDNVTLLPNNFIKDSKIDSDSTVHASVIENSIIGKQNKTGPYSRLRPKSIIGNSCKIGNFVEIKNSFIGDGTKISHLAYVGDSEIGQNCNIGCGVIFANYNGKTKSKTIVGDHVFIGSNCNLIAPLSIESESYICAGTTVTENVKKGDFVIGRTRQTNKEMRAKKYLNFEEK